jgi:hypothetical protein
MLTIIVTQSDLLIMTGFMSNTSPSHGYDKLFLLSSLVEPSWCICANMSQRGTTLAAWWDDFKMLGIFVERWEVTVLRSFDESTRVSSNAFASSADRFLYHQQRIISCFHIFQGPKKKNDDEMGWSRKSYQKAVESIFFVLLVLYPLPKYVNTYPLPWPTNPRSVPAVFHTINPGFVSLAAALA